LAAQTEGKLPFGIAPGK